VFPAEAVPDGAILAPHHYIYGMLLVLVVIGMVWDNYADREPLLAVLGAGSGLFGFVSVWPYYPVAGALLALLGPVVVIAAVTVGSFGLAVGDVWDDYPRRQRAAAVLLSLVALDDVVEHAFGVPTPLDVIWNGYLYQHATVVFPLVAAGGLAVVIIVAVYVEDRE